MACGGAGGRRRPGHWSIMTSVATCQHRILYEQCGGRSSSCQTVGSCPGLCCATGLKCLQLNEWYSQCQIDFNLAKPSGCNNVVEHYGACGGLSVCGMDGLCPRKCCRVGFNCVRQNSLYHQCQVAPPTTSRPTTPPPPTGCQPGFNKLEAWGHCGGINVCGVDGVCPQTCCTGGYQCERSN